MRAPGGLLRFAAIAVTFATASFPIAAHAGGSDAAIAEDLFADAKRLLDQGDTAHACPKFAESLRLDPTLGTRLNLAHCYEVAGKTASAWGEYKEVVRQAQAANDTKRAEVAQEKVSLVEAKLSRVTLHAAASSEHITFRLDGASLDAAVIGTPFPVDPGDHAIEEAAPGKKTATTKFHVEPQASSSVELPPLEDAPIEAPPPPPSKSADLPREPASNASTKRTVGYIVGGVGLVSIGVGTFFGIRTLSLASDVKNDCPNGPCPTQNGVDENSSAHTSALVSDITLGVGVVALAAGAYLVLTSKSGGETTHAKLQITPSASPHGGGAAILGRF